MIYLSLAFLTLFPLAAVQGSLLFAGLYLRWRSRRSRVLLLNSLADSPEEQLASERKIIVGFFHPYWYVQIFCISYER
jgi:hypothetical protein